MVVASKEKLYWLPCLAVPESDGTVLAAGCEGLSIRGKDDGTDIVGMAAKGAEQPTGFNVPHADEAFRAAARKHGPIR